MDSKCTLEGCEKSLLCKGLCRAHYDMQRKGRTLKPLSERRPYKRAICTETGKVCSKCNKHKPYDEFYAKLNACKECQIEAARKNYNEKHRKGFVPTFRDENGKVCTKCKEYKPYEKFYAEKTAKDGRQSRCAQCQSDAQKERVRNKNREAQRTVG